LRGGYSLLELLVALTILGLLLGLVLMVSLKAIRTATDSARYVSRHTMDLAAATDTPLHIPAPPPPKHGAARLIPDQYIIEFAPGANPGASADALVAAFGGGKVLHVYDTPESKGCAVHITGTSIAALQGHPGVRSVEQDGVCTKCVETIPTGVRRIGQASNTNRRINRFTPTSVGLRNVSGTLIRKPPTRIVIAVLDSGVDSTHPDLNVTFQRAFGPFAPVTDDVDGHGTHVAGSIAARVNNDGVVGVFPNAEIWNLRVLDDTGSGAWSDIIAAVNFVRNNAATVRVANMSLGGGFNGGVNNACSACAQAGVILCVAAGNDAEDARFSSPASAQNVVCVAAMGDSDGRWGGFGPDTSASEDDGFADFSNFGSVVDVIAPGVDILSCQPGNNFDSFNGTSMATPHVAGLFAVYSSSTVNIPGGRRPALGLELASLFVQAGACELIRGPGRLYPMPIDKLSKKP
jgi:prepilin-type N-terminal cleavage/methylation domain-containing protein